MLKQHSKTGINRFEFSQNRRMQFLMLTMLALWVGQTTRRIRLLRHAGQRVGARRVYQRSAFCFSMLAWLAMGGQLTILALNGLLRMDTALPLHLCGAMGVCLYPALRTRSERLREAVFYLTPPGGMAALLFPSIMNCEQQQWMTLFFFLLHAVLATAPYLLLALGWRPKTRGALTAAAFLVLLACPAGVVNQVFGANYLFLRAPAASGMLFRFPALAGAAAVVLGVEALGVWGMEKAAHRRDSECCL